MPKYVVSQSAQCVLWLHSVVEAQRKVRAMYGKHADAPVGSTIRHWMDKFIETGSVCDEKKTRTKTMRTEGNAERVREHFGNDPHASTRRASLALDMSRSTVHNILKNLKFHPYKVHIVQKLHEEDLANRTSFAEQELARMREDITHLVRIVFSDEAHFHLNGAVNRQIHRYWSTANPHWVTRGGLPLPPNHRMGRYR